MTLNDDTWALYFAVENLKNVIWFGLGLDLFFEKLFNKLESMIEWIP